jgi:hypothetical protein
MAAAQTRAMQPAAAAAQAQQQAAGGSGAADYAAPPAARTAAPLPHNKFVHPVAAAAAAKAAKAAAVGAAAPAGSVKLAGRKVKHQLGVLPLGQIHGKTAAEQAAKAQLLMAYGELWAGVRQTHADTAAAGANSKTPEGMRAAAEQFRANLAKLEVGGLRGGGARCCCCSGIPGGRSAERAPSSLLCWHAQRGAAAWDPAPLCRGEGGEGTRGWGG